MTDDYLLHPSDELRGRFIEVMRQDSVLHGLLFPPNVPAVGRLDARVYDITVELPSELRQVMPRIMVNTSPGTPPFEQVTMMGPVTVTIHCLVDRQERWRSLALDTRIRQLMGATIWSTARIIVAEPVPSGVRESYREPYLDDAWRTTSTFITANVGIAGE